MPRHILLAFPLIPLPSSRKLSASSSLQMSSPSTTNIPTDCTPQTDPRPLSFYLQAMEYGTPALTLPSSVVKSPRTSSSFVKPSPASQTPSNFPKPSSRSNILHPVTHPDADHDVWTETRPSTHASTAVELECTCCGTEWHRTVNVALPQDRFSLFDSVQWYFQATCITNESHPVRLMCSLADGALFVEVGTSLDSVLYERVCVLLSQSAHLVTDGTGLCSKIARGVFPDARAGFHLLSHVREMERNRNMSEMELTGRGWRKEVRQATGGTWGPP
ncbi:hypothetical protein C8R45DRAFT_1163279 [Mycena sanguinolenta]|nr:hypothetical protein C8R45DRAFT_1163279 [Mycena sanguinolenta]